jgi:hypothetical protein
MFNISDYLVRIGMALVMFSVMILMSSILFYKGQIQFSRPLSHHWLGRFETQISSIHHIVIEPLVQSGLAALESLQQLDSHPAPEAPVFEPPVFMDPVRLAAFQRYHITHATVNVPE